MEEIDAILDAATGEIDLLLLAGGLAGAYLERQGARHLPVLAALPQGAEPARDVPVLRTPLIHRRLRSQIAALTGIGVQPPEAVAPAERAETSLGWATGLDVLAVDDTALNRTLLTKLMKGSGANLRLCSDGLEAFQAYSTAQSDLILMDISMPFIDGYRATRLIRLFESERALRPARIVALSANSLPEHIAEAKDAGMDDFLSKPVRKQELKAAIANVLSHPGF